MKSLSIPYLYLILVCGSCHKNSETAPVPSNSFGGQLLDTLTGHPFPGCRVYLLETKNGFQTILAEAKSDKNGGFLLPAPRASLSAYVQVHVAHNAYAWKAPEPAQPEQTVWLKPYVPVTVIIRQQPPYQKLRLTGSFNESGLWLEAKPENEVLLSTTVFDTLTLELHSLETGRIQKKKVWISATNQKTDIP